MTNQNELAAQLVEVTAQVEHVRAEVVAKIAELEDALANAGIEVTQEVLDAVEALKVAVNLADDVVAG